VAAAGFVGASRPGDAQVVVGLGICPRRRSNRHRRTSGSSLHAGPPAVAVGVAGGTQGGWRCRDRHSSVAIRVCDLCDSASASTTVQQETVT